MGKRFSLFFLFLGICTLLCNIKHIKEKDFLSAYPSSLKRYIRTKKNPAKIAYLTHTTILWTMIYKILCLNTSTYKHIHLLSRDSFLLYCCWWLDSAGSSWSCALCALGRSGNPDTLSAAFDLLYWDLLCTAALLYFWAFPKTNMSHLDYRHVSRWTLGCFNAIFGCFLVISPRLISNSQLYIIQSHCSVYHLISM